MSALKERCPRDHRTAQQCFEYLFLRSSGCDDSCVEAHDHQSALTEAQKSDLSCFPFVPVSQSNTRMVEPRQCYFGKCGIQFYSHLFCFVDFGERGNSFLSMCGA